MTKIVNTIIFQCLIVNHLIFSDRLFFNFLKITEMTEILYKAVQAILSDLPYPETPCSKRLCALPAWLSGPQVFHTSKTEKKLIEKPRRRVRRVRILSSAQSVP